MLDKIDPEAARKLLTRAQEDVNTRRGLYEYLAASKIQPDPSSHEPNDHLPGT
jgi:hypothetical protein